MELYYLEQIVIVWLMQHNAFIFSYKDTDSDELNDLPEVS